MQQDQSILCCSTPTCIVLRVQGGPSVPASGRQPRVSQLLATRPWCALLARAPLCAVPSLHTTSCADRRQQGSPGLHSSINSPVLHSLLEDVPHVLCCAEGPQRNALELVPEVGGLLQQGHGVLPQRRLRGSGQHMPGGSDACIKR